MTPIEQGLAIGLGMAILVAVTGYCTRVPPGGAVIAQGTRVYRIHKVWFVFSALGGLFLSGLFAFGSFVCVPDQRGLCIACSVIAALFFAFFAYTMSSLSVTVDDAVVTVGTLFGKRSIAFGNIDRVAVVGMLVEVRQKADPATGKRKRPLTFLAGFKDLQGIIATIRARSDIGNA